MLTWQVQLWHPGSVQRVPGSRGIPRCQQRWDGGMEVLEAPMARGDGSGDRDGEEGGNWVPGAATGRWGEGDGSGDRDAEEGGNWVPGAATGAWGEREPLGSRWELGGSRTRVGGCCRDCRMGDGARIDLGYPRKEIRKAETSLGAGREMGASHPAPPARRRTRIPSQDTLSAPSRYPGRQEQRKLPGMLWQLCWQERREPGRRHSSTSAG